MSNCGKAGKCREHLSSGIPTLNLEDHNETRVTVMGLGWIHLQVGRAVAAELNREDTVRLRDFLTARIEGWES